MSSKPHPHAEVIKAWADGNIVQVFEKTTGKWFDWEGRHSPTFLPEFKYRIKPPVKKYRVALMKPRPMLITTLTNDKELERNTDFVRWLTDWIEYEE